MTNKSKPNVPESEEKHLDEAIQKILSVNPFAALAPTKEKATSVDTQEQDEKDQQSKEKSGNGLSAPPDMTKFLEDAVMMDLDELMEALEEMGLSMQELQELIMRDPEMKSLKIGEENRKRLRRLLQSMINMYNNLEKCQQQYKDGKPQEQENIQELNQNLNLAAEQYADIKQAAKQDNALDKLLTGKESDDKETSLLPEATSISEVLEELLDVSEKVVEVEEQALKKQGMERL